MEPSHRTSAPDRPAPNRADTWPHVTGNAKALSVAKAIQEDNFEEHLNQHPEAHFLSPPNGTYQYDDVYDSWSSDEEDDDEDEVDRIAWNSGVTDFALFSSDRRRAREAGEQLPQKWNNMLLNQVSALDRSLKRARAESPTDDADRPTADDAVPALTPDVSPHLADDLDVKSYHGQSAPRPVVPSYLHGEQQYMTVIVTPPPELDSAIIDDDDDEMNDSGREMRLAFFPIQLPRRRNARGAMPQRPGLSRGSRTLSGKLHVWRRPTLDSHSVQEDVHAERSAETEPKQQ